jgi:hypothetical protein
MAAPTSLAPCAATGTRSRQAALLLHGLANADRDWLLGELASGQRRLLEALLAELHALGVPASPEWIDELLLPRSTTPGTAGAPSPKVATAEAPAEPDALPPDALPAEAVAGVLRDEPDALVARAVRDGAADWRHAVLRRLGAARRRRLGAATAEATGTRQGGGERLDAALASALRQRCRDVHSAGRASLPAGPAARLAGSLRRLARFRNDADVSSRSTR